jgi:toxin ParE1/3/4
LSSQIEILPAAQADLIDIGDYIALDNPERARSFVAKIHDLIFKQIAVRPSSFPLRADLAPNLRVARYRRYLIFFTQFAGSIHIVRVLHGARHIPDIMLSDKSDI